MKLNFIPIDYSYFDFKGRNYAKIVGRSDSGKRVCVIDSCPVYLWAILKNNLSKEKIDKLIEKIKKIKLDVKGRETKVEKVELCEKNFSGKKVKALKIFATNYKDLHDIADKLDLEEIDFRRGYDLGFVTHYIIERKINPLNWYEITGEVLHNSLEFNQIDTSLDVDICIKLEGYKKIEEKNFLPKVLAYDIETDELKIGEGEILMVSLGGENFKKVITWKKVEDKKPDYVEYVEDEAELIEKFSEYVKEISPDFLVGYYSDGFDLPYIKARAMKNKVKINFGIDGSEPKFSRGVNIQAKVDGIVHVDILRFIRTAYAQYMQSETLTLNEVAKEFLQDKKKKFEIKHSSKLGEKDFREYYEYNLQDSVLTYGLFMKFWPDLLEFSKVVGEPVFDVSRNGLSKQVENYILHNLEKHNEIPEKRPIHSEISSRRQSGGVEGAYVFSPEAGLYEDIAIFDFTSMHTSIIISMNISKSTLLEKKEKGCFESPEVMFNGEKKKFYFSHEKGFIPLLVEELFRKRKKYKAEYKKNPNRITLARSNAFKLLSASIHGYIGFFGARYYSKESSASILGFVRQFNKDIIKKTEDVGYKVIFGDTDSEGFLMKEKSEKEVKEFLKKLNSELPGVMELELEGFFKRGLWVKTRGGTTGAKKKYAVIDKYCKLKIRGFETVRRDWCKLARKLQNKIILQILKDGNEKKALEFVKEIIKKIKSREVKKEDLIIRTQLKKPISEYKTLSPHVVAAKKMKEQKIPVEQGGLIEYFIAETQDKKKLVRDKVKLPHEEDEYNIEYYLNKQVMPAVENIFEVFGINIKEIVDGKKQEGLGKWF
ncbi:MAG: DNA-directed DNA polymerase [Candidatus Pacearchaeota archaeon]|jgi:DNA polymerase elongation subunit (family B)